MTLQTLSPIFVMGPARGGTTITYQLLVEAFDALYVDSFTVATMDPENMSAFSDTPEARARFNERLAALGAVDRGVDPWPVDDRLPEEFTLISKGGALKLRVRLDLDWVAELLRALRHDGGSDRPIVLKDPRTVADTRRLCDRFTSSGFVFVRRNAAEILASQQRAILRAVRQDSPYSRLVAGGDHLGPMTLETWWRRVAGEERMGRRLRTVLSRRLEGQLSDALEAYASVPPGRRVVLDHAAMCREPRAELPKLARLGDVEIPRSALALVREPRKADPDEVELARRRVSADIWRRWHGDWEVTGG